MADAKGKDWRTAPTRRPSAFGAARTQPDPLEPPTMSRSRVQIAGSYAPGVLMTWEGGKGICRSVPLANEAKDLKPTTISLIFENLSDSITNWRDRALKALPDALPELVLDTPFRDSKTGEARVERADFQMTSPDKVGYVPCPLLYRCGICGSTREFDSVGDQSRQPLPKKCNGHEARWTQVDVVYVHWSGDIEPLSPFNYNFDPQTGTAKSIRVCTCGSTSFRLRNDAPVFSEWRGRACRCSPPAPRQRQRDPGSVVQRWHRRAWSARQSGRSPGHRRARGLDAALRPEGHDAGPRQHLRDVAQLFRRLATLNDSFRHSSVGGHTVITRGVAALGEAAALAILSMVRSFDAFTADNDPHGEHDFGALRWGEYELFWTISYYDPTLRFGSQDPADPTLTCRVLTVMLREEY